VLCRAFLFLESLRAQALHGARRHRLGYMSEQASEKAAKERLLVRLFYDWGLCFVLPPPVGSVSAVEARA